MTAAREGTERCPIAYYLAVDQGGTKTEAAVFTEQGRILGVGDDRDRRMPDERYTQIQREMIGIAASRALDAAHLSLDQLSGACLALNGADWPHEYPALALMASDVLRLAVERVTVINDCIGAMWAVREGGNRGVICAGTGLNCAVQRVGAPPFLYGYFINDSDQGGSALGKAAFSAIIDAHNGLGPDTSLLDATLRHYASASLEALYMDITAGRIDFKPKDLSPLLMSAARGGDAVARRILETTADRLARYVLCGIEHVGIPGEPLTLVLSGGVFKGDGICLEREIVCKLRARPEITVRQARMEPVVGTARYMLRAVLGNADERIDRNLEETAEQFGCVRMG